MIEKGFKDVTIMTSEQQDLGDPGGKSFILLILCTSTYLNVFYDDSIFLWLFKNFIVYLLLLN